MQMPTYKSQKEGNAIEKAEVVFNAQSNKWNSYSLSSS
jgi:hypothetical protein